MLGRPELTITLDIATPTIGAAVLRPAGTTAVDAAVLAANGLPPIDEKDEDAGNFGELQYVSGVLKVSPDVRRTK